MSSAKLTDIPKKQWACSDLKLERLTYDWTIRHFEFLTHENGTLISSPFFYTGHHGEKWQLGLFPRGKTKESTDNISIYLYLVASQRFRITCRSGISVFKKDILVHRHRMKTWTFTEPAAIGCSQFLKRSTLLHSDSDDTADDTIMIRCEIDLPVGDRITISSDTPANEAEASGPQKCPLSEHLRAVLAQSQFSDVTIIVGDQRIPAHKIILTARSSVFAAMFHREDVEGNRKNEVQIEDLEPKVVRSMLEFVYTNEVTDFEELTIELLGAAEKYDLDGLKSECVKTISRILDQGNAVEILVLADRYGLAALKQNVVEYIKAHFEEVAKTEGYDKLNDPGLLKEINRLLYSKT